MPPVLGPLISSVRCLLIEIESDVGTTGLLLLAQNVFEQRMAGFAQEEAALIFGTDARDDAIEVHGEFRFGEDQFQPRQRFDGTLRFRWRAAAGAP